MTWLEEIREVVSGLPAGTFTLRELYFRSTPLAARHPGNSSVEDTIRRVLQELRDKGEIEFLEGRRGVYRWLGSQEGPALERISNPANDDHIDVEPGVPDQVPLENRSASAYAVPATEARVFIEREVALVSAFESFLTANGGEAKRWRIPTRSNSGLYTDIYDVSTGVLYEAKGVATRESIRLAIGQLLDYDRYVHAVSLAVLLPERPSIDMLDLLSELGFGCTWLEGSEFVSVAGDARGA